MYLEVLIRVKAYMGLSIMSVLAPPPPLEITTAKRGMRHSCWYGQQSKKYLTRILHINVKGSIPSVCFSSYSPCMYVCM